VRIPLVTISALLGLALAFTQVRARGPDLGESSPEMWRAWRPLVSAFGGGDVAATIAYLRASSALVRKADAQLARDAETERFRKRAIASMEDFELDDFLALLPHAQADYRSFAFEGRPSEQAYQVRAEADTSRAFAGPRSLPFGHSYGAVRMRRMPHASERRYAFHLRSGVGLGTLRWQSLLAGLLDAGRLIETPVERDVPLVLRAADTYLRTRQQALGQRDRTVLARVWGGFPGIAQLLLPISRTDDLVAERDAAPGVTGLSLATRWNLSGMERKYPALAHYFDALDDIAKVRAVLRDEAGRSLLELDSETQHLETKLRGFLHDGRLLARAGKQGALEPARFERMRLTLDLSFVLHRIRLNIEQLEIDLSYRAGREGATVRATSTRVPKVSVSGAAFGLLPTRVLDWFIPGDVETLARHMFEVAARAGGGRGSMLEAQFRESREGATLELDYQTELLDTTLIRFCMAAIADAAIPSDEEERDITRLAVDYRDAFDADLARFAKFGVGTFAPAP
jgi:hypothetical protein